MTSTLPRIRTLLVVVVALIAGGCTGATVQTSAPVTIPPTTDTIAPPPTVPPDTTPPTTAAPAPPPAGLTAGMKGAEVEALQVQLAALKFSPGTIDGVYAQMTVHAVMAFQKTWGLERTGRADPTTLARIAEAPILEPMLPTGGQTRVEIDLNRQILALYVDGGLHRVLSISSGNNKRYCDNGRCGVAVTPGGSYRVGWRHRGIRVAPLGKLWNPLFFNGGIAIHGSPSVPAYPASHGCVRIPIPDSTWFYDTVPNGTPVYVLGGRRAAVPFAPAPPASSTTTAPPGSTTTSTTPPSTTTTTTTTTTP